MSFILIQGRKYGFKYVKVEKEGYIKVNLDLDIW